MSAALLTVALLAYMLSIVLAGLGTFLRQEWARVSAAVLFVAAWAGHAGAVVRRGLDAAQFPLSNVAEYLLALGLAVMTLHLVLWFGWRVHAAGLVLPPIAAGTALAALALLEAGPALPVVHPRGWLLLHVTVSTLSMALLIVALAMSLIYVFQDRALKSRRTLALLGRLPSLERCDHLAFHALVVGFALLSLGILAGVVVNVTAHDRLWVPGIKQTPPLLAWLVLGSVIGARWQLGFRGRKSAYLTITGVILGLLTVVGMTSL